MLTTTCARNFCLHKTWIQHDFSFIFFNWSYITLFCSEHFDFTPTGISGIYISIAIISILGTKYAASISDRFGRKRTLVPGSLLIGFSTILFPFSPEFYSLCSLVGIWGLGSALI